MDIMKEDYCQYWNSICKPNLMGDCGIKLEESTMAFQTQSIPFPTVAANATTIKEKSSTNSCIVLFGIVASRPLSFEDPFGHRFQHYLEVVLDVKISDAQWNSCFK